jgi:hypothetical protein
MDTTTLPIIFLLVLVLLMAAGTGVGAGTDADASESTPLPKDPDRSHLDDAIHFMDLIQLADEELPAARATVERSKAEAVTARMELDKHQRWLGQHEELYAQAVKECERRLKRKAFIGACKQTAWLPIQFLSTAWTGLIHAGLSYPRRIAFRSWITQASTRLHGNFRRAFGSSTEAKPRETVW